MHVSPEYFATLGITITQGRGFDAGEGRAESPVAVKVTIRLRPEYDFHVLPAAPVDQRPVLVIEESSWLSH